MNARFSSQLIILIMVAILISSPVSAVQAAPTQARGRTGLSQAEADGLTYMREEEKLAHDVYVVMYSKWGAVVFSNISSSESNHMAAIKNLLDRYNLPDPAQGNRPGEFDNAELQALYNALIERGNLSLGEALKVGGAIEEIDILDLKHHLAETNHQDITNVYSNLVSASCNHLRAFSSTLQRQTGEIYQPQFLSPEAYQVIINGGC